MRFLEQVHVHVQASRRRRVVAPLRAHATQVRANVLPLLFTPQSKRRTCARRFNILCSVCVCRQRVI